MVAAATGARTKRSRNLNLRKAALISAAAEPGERRQWARSRPRGPAAAQLHCLDSTELARAAACRRRRPCARWAAAAKGRLAAEADGEGAQAAAE